MTSKSEPVSEKIRVLLVDDHKVMRDGTRLILEAADDIEVVAEAESGEDAVRLALLLKPDVVVLDIKLKGQSGVQAAGRIKAEAPESQIVVLTAYDYDQYVRAMLEAGALGYILKSDGGRELVEAVRLVSEGSSAFSYWVAQRLIAEFCRATATKKPFPELSQRELEVLRLAARGGPYQQIAEGLGISTRTVESHIRNICDKLKVDTREDAVIEARKRGYGILSQWGPEFEPLED
ncbi:MAG: response regulator transcription factor [Chloroflexi bacterium]|nr:response regulator transcription factor [Chloroflexota bacterium]